MRQCDWAREFYQDQKKSGKHHNTAMRNLATKWLRILFRLWKNGEVYDEDLYLKRRDERKAPIVAGQKTLTSL